MRPSLISGIIVLALTGVLGYKVVARHRAEAQRVRIQLEHGVQREDRRSQLEASQRLVESYRKRLAPEEEVVWLVRESGRLAREAEIQLSAVNPRRLRQVGGFSQLAVSLHFQTSYHQLGQFLSRIESAEHLLYVDELDFTLVRKPDGSPVAEVNLVVSALYLPPVTR